MADAGASDEAARLRALARYEVMDSPAEPAFDRITAVVARVLDVPIALVSLVDADRQWFKSCVGLDVAETPRGVAFCDHAIRRDDLLVVPDAAGDPRFANNPLVTGPPHVRSYVGAPLVTPTGQRIGTLCAIDRRPRQHGDADLATLADLAAVVVELLEKRVADRGQAVLQRVGATSPNVGYVYDLVVGRAVWASANAVAAFGIDITQPEAHAWDLVHPDDVAGLVTHYQNLTVAPDDRARETTFRMRAAGGDYRWLLCRETPYLRDPDGLVISVVGLAIDITRLKAAEERAIASEEQLAERLMVLEAVLECAGEGIMFADERGQLRVANSIARDLVGSRPAASGLPDEGYVRDAGIYQEDGRAPVDPADLPLVRALRGEAVGPTAVIVRNERHPDGVHLTVRAHTVRDAAGVVRGAVATLANVTGERRARQAATTMEASFRALTEALSIGVFVQRGPTLYANPALAAILDRDRAELVGRDYRELIHPDDHATVAARVANTLAGGRNPPMELRLLGADGVVAVEAIGIAIEFDGAPAILVKCRDVRAERAAANALRASVREKEILLREIHHRVKNNLAVVSSLLFIQSRSIADPAARAALAETRSRIQSISLVHEHLYRSNDLGQVDLAAYVQSLTEQVSRALGADRRHITVSVEAEAVGVTLDVAMPCGLIVSELVTNALKHAFPDRRAGRVHVTVRELADALEIAVTDDGVGMAGDRATGRPGSLGHELVRALVDQLRGTLSVTVDGGTRLALVFPRSP